MGYLVEYLVHAVGFLLAELSIKISHLLRPSRGWLHVLNFRHHMLDLTIHVFVVIQNLIYFFRKLISLWKCSLLFKITVCAVLLDRPVFESFLQLLPLLLVKSFRTGHITKARSTAETIVLFLHEFEKFQIAYSLLLELVFHLFDSA